MAGELEGSKPLSGLLSGLAQEAFHGHQGITEELLRSQLYPDVSLEEFRPFLAKMRGILKSIASADMDFSQLEAFLTAQTKKQGGITCDQAAVISKFWKSHKTKIRESLMNQSRWDSGLRGLSWRVDGKSQSRHSAQIHTPVAIMELEIGKSGQREGASKHFLQKNHDPQVVRFCFFAIFMAFLLLTSRCPFCLLAALLFVLNIPIIEF
ncbi:COMM domain-containing protein 1 isoform X2 [Leopardus geoffroyi]|uniref:COMM domain-containing protein 1 isoform X2 n=1 Tax=Leopardus geoffroyi TaxID=46844 RepID=UPI001E25E24E|nr:COMM domain-containing protein 1 isoform X2 [Leopardus geoffroyi]